MNNIKLSDSTDLFKYGTQSVLLEQPDSPRLQESHVVLTRLQEIGILRKNTKVGQEAISHTNGTTYTTFGKVAEQFVHVKYLLAGKDGNYRKSKGEDLPLLQERAKVTIVSGPCLFSGSSMKALDKNGQEHLLNYPPHLDTMTSPIVSIVFDPNLQPYEADALLRFEKMMQLIDRTKQVTVALNVPRVEYYCYLLYLYEKQLVDKTTLLDYFAIVDQRARAIEQMMKKRIPTSVEVTSINPLDCVEDVIRTGIEQDDTYLFSEVIAVLSQDNIYKQALKRCKPQSFKDLCQLSYSLAQLCLAKDKDTTLVILENPEEIPTFHETANLLAGIVQKAQVIGLYSHPKAVLASDGDSVIGRRYLYFYKGQGRRDIKEVIQANREN